MSSSGYSPYHWCLVSECKNTSVKTPEKLWIQVPTDLKMRNTWLKLARRDPKSLSTKTKYYFCEDHFDLPNDMENYMEFHLLGSVSRIRMKPGCMPTKFQCQPDRRKRTCNTTERPYILKKQRKTLIEECEKELEEKTVATKQAELEETPSGSSGTKCIRNTLARNSVPSLKVYNTRKQTRTRSNENRMNVEENNDINDAVKMENDFECRACLQSYGADSYLINIFEPWHTKLEGMQETIAEDLSKISNIKISETDVHSKLICEVCCERLREACTFAALVYNNDWLLRQRSGSFDVNSEEIWPKPIQLDKNINENIYDTTNVEIKQEVLSDEEHTAFNGLDEDSREEILNLDIKIEPEEIIDTNCTQINVNGTISEENHIENTTLTNGTASYSHDSEETETVIKEEPLSDDEDACLEPTDLPLECMLCTKSFNSLSGLKGHVITHHSYKSVKRKSNNNPSPEKKQNNKHYCTICRRSLMTLTDLIVHETCHNKFVCYGCNAKFDSFDFLAKHRKKCKSNSTEVKKPILTLEDVKRPKLDNTEVKEQDTSTLHCQLCDETFTDVYYMNIHKEIHHNTATQSASPLEAPTSMESESLESIFTEK